MSSRLRIAVIGAGGIARAYHLPAIQHVQELDTVVLVDISEERAQQAASEYGFNRWTVDAEEAMSAADVDAVFIFTPNDSHATLSEQAGEYGKHVFVQKPMGRSPDECERMVANCRQHGVHLVPSFMHRYLPEVWATRRYVQEGYLGNIESVRVRNAPGAASLVAANYYSRELVGGGAVLDIGIHGIDMVRYLVGEIEEVSFARMQTTRQEIVFPDQTVYPDNEDLALAVYRTEGGADVVHEISWHQRTPADRFSMELHGSAGSILLRGGPGPLTLSSERFGRGGDWVVPQIPVYDSGERHHREVAEFMLGVGDHDVATGEDGLRASELIDDVYEAAGEAGRPSRESGVGLPVHESAPGS